MESIFCSRPHNYYSVATHNLRRSAAPHRKTVTRADAAPRRDASLADWDGAEPASRCKAPIAMVI